jgi:hypothetical protein
MSYFEDCWQYKDKKVLADVHWVYPDEDGIIHLCRRCTDRRAEAQFSDDRAFPFAENH